MKHWTSCIIVSLTLLFSISGLAAATVPELPQQQQLPPGVEAGWWQTVQKNIRASEYHFAWQEQAAAYQAPNRAQNLRLTFSATGLRVMPRSDEATA